MALIDSITERLNEYRPKLEALYNTEGTLSNDEASDQDWYQGYIDALEFVLIQLDKQK
jgi:hypothetical protein